MNSRHDSEAAFSRMYACVNIPLIRRLVIWKVFLYNYGWTMKLRMQHLHFRFEMPRCFMRILIACDTWLILNLHESSYFCRCLGKSIQTFYQRVRRAIFRKDLDRCSVTVRLKSVWWTKYWRRVVGLFLIRVGCYDKCSHSSSVKSNAIHRITKTQGTHIETANVCFASCC